MPMYTRMYRPYVGAAMGYLYSIAALIHGLLLLSYIRQLLLVYMPIAAPIHMRIYGHCCPYIYMAVAAPIGPPIDATIRGCIAAVPAATNWI